MFESTHNNLFEHEPLVPTNEESGKVDIDAFLTKAKKSQRKWFSIISVFSAISIVYGLYLLSQYPGRLFSQQSTSLSPINTCTPASTPSYTLTMINTLIVLLPVILWADQLVGLLRSSPTHGPNVISYKPYVRSTRLTSNDLTTTPEQYYQQISSHALSWSQTTVIGLTLLSALGCACTFFFGNSQLCQTSPYTLRVPYLAGTIVFASVFVGILATMVYKHKNQLSNTPSSLGLDAYHPL